MERQFSDSSQFTDGDGVSFGSADLEAALAACVTGWSQQRTALLSQLSNVARLRRHLTDLAEAAWQTGGIEFYLSLMKAGPLPLAASLHHAHSAATDRPHTR